MKHKSLKTKVLFTFGSLSMLTLIAFGFSFYYFFNLNMIETVKNRLSSQSFDIKEQLDQSGLNGIHSEYPFVVIQNNQLIFKSKKFNFKDWEKYINKKETFFALEGEESQMAVNILRFKKPFEGAIIVSKDDIDEELENIILTILVLEPILFILLLLLANRMIDNILKPIQNINAVAKEISVHNFQDQISPGQSDDEIQELIQTFNMMTGRLKEGVEKLDRFNSDISHELKTPLTVINGKIELSLKKERDREYYKESLRTIQYESDKIQKIVDVLLQLTKYSKEKIEENFVACDFNAILLEVVEKYLPKAEAKKMDLEIVKFEKAGREANPALISAIFSNIIDNAIKYSPVGKKVAISLYTDQKIHFIVQDYGIGIPKDKLPRITDRFYRADESRNKEIDGFGLGLSIVKNSVELHQGSLEIESKPGKGMTVEVLL